jgi:hypothetical protein
MHCWCVLHAAEDIAREHPDLYRVWRQEPERFCLDGRYPVLEAFRQARRAWKGGQLGGPRASVGVGLAQEAV